MNRKEYLIQSLREALLRLLVESQDVTAVIAELVDMGCLPQIEVKVLAQQGERADRIDPGAYDQDFLRSMRIAGE